eukprot:TRINITY_DN5183_c0_g1_i2.p1 TRINITY_DN5183_c0_g1~~TRINITY_DN5183_c0_g1_i2.p1  ORF type:complete len:679 (+),score=185.48 TRINITY_DN5183_c0_g1_i2:76-2112(+)
MSEKLPFEAPVVQMKVEFWHDLEQKKLTVFKLSTDPVEISYHYTSCKAKGRSQKFEVRKVARGNDGETAPSDVCVPGLLLNANTIEEFRDQTEASNRQRLISDAGAALWKAIASRSWKEDPSVLCPLRILSFADLKKHEFHYMVAMPALGTKPPLTSTPARPVTAVFDASKVEALRMVCAHAREPGRYALQIPAHTSCFVVRRCGEVFEPAPVTTLSKDDKERLEDGTAMLVVVDPAGGAAAGWPLRTLVLAAGLDVGAKAVHCLLLREGTTIDHSLVLRVDMPDLPPLPPPGEETPEMPAALSATGWLRFPGKQAGEAQTVDLSAMMDDKKLAQSSAHLNLSLMKWRMAPDLDLEGLASTKCLLVGSGTLGCNVARNLMMWGVHDITFIDRGRVSFSNPVRQSLFCHEDALRGGRNKAEAAADACHRIFPLSEAKHVDLSVPMPGHPVGQAAEPEVRRTCERLRDLVRAADVVFLLTDSRESRWLPTLLAAAERKKVVNAALGFDSYLVMRHGLPSEGAAAEAERPGCYFCSDVTAPSDSLSDRTLDQQCTVTRAGGSAIAGALAVELMVSMLSHKQGAFAPAPGKEGDTGTLGTVPHQIRGRLFGFDQMLLQGSHFPQCVACGEAVLRQYEQRGIEFLLDAFNRDGLLEEVSGLKQLQAAAEEKIAECEDWDDDEN